MSIFLAILLLGACAHAFDPFLADPLEIALAIRLTGNNRSFGMQPPTGVPPGHQPATSIPHNSSVLAAVTRDEVMKCAMQWVQEKVRVMRDRSLFFILKREKTHCEIFVF
jgi:hypothetical protein